jgi:hypothetical protein
MRKHRRSPNNESESQLKMPLVSSEDRIMTTLAKIEANQRNAALSTGPRTAEGKAVVARNATRHGIYSSVPVIPGEDPNAWEAHRAGVVDSLAPAGLLEVNLAERAALLLWRLQRLARYEAETIAAAMEDVEVPPLPPPADPIPPAFPIPPQPTRDEQLRDLRHELREARESLAEVAPARDFLQSFPEPGTAAAVPFTVAAYVLEFGLGRAQTSENARSDPRRFDSKPFLKKLGLTATDAATVDWTPDLIRRALGLYADCAGETPDRLIELVRGDLWRSRLRNSNGRFGVWNARPMRSRGCWTARQRGSSRRSYSPGMGGTSGSPGSSGT